MESELSEKHLLHRDLSATSDKVTAFSTVFNLYTWAVNACNAMQGEVTVII